jgi:hypothetical protein
MDKSLEQLIGDCLATQHAWEISANELIDGIEESYSDADVSSFRSLIEFVSESRQGWQSLLLLINSEAE